MTPRENLVSLYRRQGYQHAPVEFSLCPSLWDHYQTIAGNTPLEEYFGYPEGFGADHFWSTIRHQQPGIDWAGFHEGGVAPGTHFDDFGIAHEPGSIEARHMTRMRHPMANMTSVEQILAYPWPTVDWQDLCAITSHVNDAHARGKAACGEMACTIWETAWYLRDMTVLMTDMMIADEKATVLLDTITALSCEQARAYARAGVDILCIGDDIGTQNSIMMSHDMYREWLKPRLARVIAAARSEKPDILVQYHSCGYVEPFIGDLIDAGVDILNPVQPECMDFGAIHERWGTRLSFNGTIGTQTTLPFGRPEEVRQTVLRNLEIAGSTGGLLACPTHLVEPEVPWENIVAYVEACKEFGIAGS